MSLRLEMLQVARLAPRLLGDSVDLVRAFLHRQQNPDGGFQDRTGRSDLYYTVFGVDALLALQAELPVQPLGFYLKTFGEGEGLDFVHLCCLARGVAALRNQGLSEAWPEDWANRLLHRLESFRAQDGGYHPNLNQPTGSAYGAFLALGAYQDLKRTLPAPLTVVKSLDSLATPEGAWANEHQMKTGATNSTAAAVAVLRNLNIPVNQPTADWLLAQANPLGGFRATPTAPIPDLLSTATALHTLAGLQASIESVKEPCLDFIDTLWTNEGSFHGHWHEEQLDTEYTYYGLLALGHLAL